MNVVINHSPVSLFHLLPLPPGPPSRGRLKSPPKCNPFPRVITPHIVTSNMCISYPALPPPTSHTHCPLYLSTIFPSCLHRVAPPNIPSPESLSTISLDPTVVGWPCWSAESLSQSGVTSSSLTPYPELPVLPVPHPATPNCFFPPH